MATKIEGGTLPPKQVGKKTARRRRSGKYPWDQWFDGSVWRLTRGEDFTVKPESFRTAALAAAARYDVKLATRRVNNSVILIQVIDDARPEAVKPETPKRGWRFWRQS